MTIDSAMTFCASSANGRVPESPLSMNKKRRIAGDPRKRAAACKAFAENPYMYRSLKLFVEAHRQSAEDGAWKPSKSQMARDMSTIYGAGWPARRGGGGRARGGGKAAAATAPGLVTPADSWLMLEPSHHPTTLSSAMENHLIQSLRSFEQRFGSNIITPVLIESLAMNKVLAQIPSNGNQQQAGDMLTEGALQNVINVVLRQLASVSSSEWVRSFLRRNKYAVRRTSRKRALEQHKAAKHQPELVLAHFRNLFQAEALAQIQRHIARTGQSIPGFVRFAGIIQQDRHSPDEVLESLLEARDGVLYVKALDAPLEHVSAKRRYALDETPVNPDSPMLKAYTTGNGVPLSCGRAAIWTLLPVLCGDGSVSATLLLQRCQSLPVDAVKFTSANDLCVAATENAQQSDDSWLSFAKIWLPRTNSSFADPGFVYIDGHSSHVTRAFIQAAAEHSIYVIVEPSHTSIILQVADVGINRFLKTKYEQEYTASLCTSAVTGRLFDDVERIGCIVRTVQALKTKTKMIADCFKKCGLLSGYNDVHQHFSPTIFNAGASLRDPNLPQVNTAYIKAMFTLTNLAAARGAPVTIPESVITAQQRTIAEYVTAGAGFRRFYFALGASADTNDACDYSSSIEPVDAMHVVAQGVRKLFKLGRALNVPRGAPGRLSAAYGSLASAVDQWNAAVKAEEAATKAAAARAEREKLRAASEQKELPIVNMLINAGYMKKGERLLKRTLTAMLSLNPRLIGSLGLAANASKGALVDALLVRIESGTLDIVSASQAGADAQNNNRNLTVLN